MEVYFDNSATTKAYEEVCVDMSLAMREYYANPSSLHKLGLKCQRRLIEAREGIAKTINATKEEILFISGGSEGNNTILRGIAKPGNHIITTAFEHPSVLDTCRELEAKGVRVTYLGLDSNGRIDLDVLKNSITKDTVLVSIMHVNNEIGSISDLEAIGKIIKENSQRAKYHVDGVQGYGKFKVDVKKLNIDFYSISAHKIHGPKGIGFLYMKKDLNFASLITGGGQESGHRAGTENLPAIIGMQKACEITMQNLDKSFETVKELKTYFVERLSEIENIRINSKVEDFMSPYILNVSFIGARAEVLLHLLEDSDIYISTGSACSSKKVISKGSHVLNAIGLKPNEIESAIRFSFSGENTKDEADYVIAALKKSLLFLRRFKR
ncbi:cysteine desulfurase family protein [uncultured Clostridium sp.]|uniref:cysteine desulfurase family protein n=1 Tax=uncultured Clostridium sp. TaxID=59620 RepID=UPI0026325AC3|nr:cysteine desulfurase family protein [uncultured Clostridium sp.]